MLPPSNSSAAVRFDTHSPSFHPCLERAAINRQLAAASVGRSIVQSCRTPGAVQKCGTEMRGSVRKERRRRFQVHPFTAGTRMPRVAAEERFDSFVPRLPRSRCWPWLGYVRPNGYGRFMVAAGKPVYAHRFAWERIHGKIPKPLVIDHLCRNRACVNPAHLEVVTQRENLLRSPLTTSSRNAARKRCNSGHKFDGVSTEGFRKCNRCRRERRQRERQRRTA